MNKQLPIFEYPGGTPVTFLPPNTEFKWIEPLGGGTLNGPATWGTVRPDGRPAHGGVLTYVNTIPRVEYHGFSNGSSYANPYYR